MKEIIIISFGYAKENFDMTVKFLGQKYKVKRLGVDFDYNLARDLVEKYRHECDIFAFSGFPIDLKLDGKLHTHFQVKELKEVAVDTPVADGSQLKSLAIPMFLKNLSQNHPTLLKNKRFAFFSGVAQWDYLPAYQELSPKLVFADIFMALQVPKLIRGSADMKAFLKKSLPVLKKINLEGLKERDFRSPITKFPSMKDFFEADIYVVNETQLEYIKLQDLSGKTVIIDQIDDFSRKQLEKANVEKIYSCFPDFFNLPHIGFTGLEALLLAHTGKSTLSQEDLLELIERYEINPANYVPRPQATNSVDKFSFIIHPLGRSQLFPFMKPLLKTPAGAQLESMLALAPGFHYGRITGIKSLHNGKEVEADLFALPMTPKVMMKQEAEKVYQALTKLCFEAKSKGSKIIGLGAYTKIVGDAGVTVNDRSPIPVTTGNSLSASSTLWAAGYAVDRMNLVEKKGNVYAGTAMVIGATGSIGKVCAKILCRQWERVIICAPRPYKVLELVSELKQLYPETEVIGTSSPDKYSPQSNLIITSTSAQGETIMDIMKVKPGCVICDVSRPFDITLDDAAKRPDVVVIASGEVTLPGDVKISKTLHLPGSSVYACLAETAILAMEGRFESFSMSRDLSYEKVCEIDKLARKHGVRLSAIMGHTGEITEEEIELCREHALRALGIS